MLLLSSTIDYYYSSLYLALATMIVAMTIILSVGTLLGVSIHYNFKTICRLYPIVSQGIDCNRHVMTSFAGLVLHKGNKVPATEGGKARIAKGGTEVY